MEPIKELRAGDPDAIDWLVESFSDRLLKAATLILGDQHSAEDAVQDCLVNAITHLSGFRGESSIYTWLYTILIRGCRQTQHKAFWKQAQYFPKGVLERQLYESSDEYGAIHELTDHMMLRNAIKSLTYKYREVIVLFYYEDFSVETISMLLNVPQGTVKNRLHRARKKLKVLLEEEGQLCL